MTSNVTARPASGWLKSNDERVALDASRTTPAIDLAVGRRKADDVADAVVAVGVAFGVERARG